MCAAFFSLLGSLAQANFVRNGDIVLNVAMTGGGVDWLGGLGPRHHYRRCLGDCFPQALMAS